MRKTRIIKWTKMVKDEKGWNKHLESFFTEGKVHQDSNHRVKSPMWKRMTARFGRCQEDLRWNTRPEDRTCQRKHQRWHCGLAWDRGGARTTHGALKNWSKLSKTFIHLSLDSFICCHCVLNLSGIAAWVFQILDLFLRFSNLHLRQRQRHEENAIFFWLFGLRCFA